MSNPTKQTPSQDVYVYLPAIYKTGRSTPSPTPTPSPSPSPSPSPTPSNQIVNWPLRLSSQGKYLEDQSGTPYFIIADAGWELTTQVSTQDAINYIDDRHNKDINGVEIRIIGRSFQSNAPNDYYNQPPFSLGPTNWSMRNETYWSRIDGLIDHMRDQGMTVILFPAYLGYDCSNQGWCQEMIGQTDAVMYDYGQWIGNRYKDFGNIIWMTGGDTNATGTALSRNNAIVSGIRSVDTDAIFSVEPQNNTLGGVDSYSNVVDINAVYAYSNPASDVHRAYQEPRPFMYQEGLYENEHNTSVDTQQSQAMITYLGGGLIGHIFGSCPLWNFSAQPNWCDRSTSPFDSWQSNLNSPGSVSLSFIAQLMRSRQWWNLVPDYSNVVVTSNKGSEINYHATARTSDGQTIMVWAPNTNQITVNLSYITGTQANAWWFALDTGTTSQIGTFSTSGSQSFTPPGSRQVLVIDQTQANLPAPGSNVYINH